MTRINARSRAFAGTAGNGSSASPKIIRDAIMFILGVVVALFIVSYNNFTKLDNLEDLWDVNGNVNGNSHPNGQHGHPTMVSPNSDASSRSTTATATATAKSTAAIPTNEPTNSPPTPAPTTAATFHPWPTPTKPPPSKPTDAPKEEEPIVFIGATNPHHHMNNDKDKDDTSTSSSSSALGHQAHFCSAFHQHIPTTTSIWTKHTADLLNWTRHKFDKFRNVWYFHDWQLVLSHLVSADILQNSIKTLPFHYWDKVEDVFQIGYNRYQWLKLKPKERKLVPEPRPLVILVLGGSVTQGVQGDGNPLIPFGGWNHRRESIHWPIRLSWFILHSLGVYGAGDLTKIVTLAHGGANTETGIAIWDYSMYPDHLGIPDVVINAYSTNDMHVLSEKEAERLGITLEESVLRMNQKFIRTVLSSHGNDSSCKRKPPLLLYFDDYIGNEQKQLFKTNAYSRAITTLSQHYGFGVISYADAARHFVYPNTKETWFSPKEWPDRNIHPTMGMHIVSTWIIAFNFLHYATSFCSMPQKEILENVESTDPKLTWNYGYNVSRLDGLQPLTNIHRHIQLLTDDWQIPDGPTIPSRWVLPPELNETLTLENISQLYDEAAERVDTSATTCTEETHGRQEKIRPCFYGWISKLTMEENYIGSEINATVYEYIVSNDGWEGKDDNNKPGFSALKADANFVMEFKNVTKPIQTLNFMVMTSYGENWEGTKMHVDSIIAKGAQELNAGAPSGSMDILGYHDKHTSETYRHQLNLDSADGKGVQPGDSLRVSFKLVGGSTFKIMGMLFCPF